MTSSEWRKVPGYGQRGVDILADLEEAENLQFVMCADSTAFLAQARRLRTALNWGRTIQTDTDAAGMELDVQLSEWLRESESILCETADLEATP